MMYLQKSFTVLAAPSKITACEACVYNRGSHADWCPVQMEQIAHALGYRIGGIYEVPIP